MTEKRYKELICFLALFFLMSLDGPGSTVAKVKGPPDASWANIKTAHELADFFDKRSNPKTGLSLSLIGDPRPIARYGAQIYDIGLRLLADSVYSRQIVDTFAKDNSSPATRDAPQTMAGGTCAGKGVFSWIRIKGFKQPGWWQSWEWSIKTGENAWLGKGALHYYRRTRDSRGLAVAVHRADFILKLQDHDGGIREGPKLPKKDLWWRVKSTENNESALDFLDEIYLTTRNPRYKKAADRIYQWLLSTMYDRQHHRFLQGEVEKAGKWVIDDSLNPATDTTAWAPLERMLKDPRFGKDRVERLAEVGRMLAATVAATGVFRDGVLKGLSYSSLSRKDAVISVEWTAQFALRCLNVSVDYQGLGIMDKAARYYRQYAELLGQLQRYIKKRDGEMTIPAAVYPNGRIAAGEPMWDVWTRTPSAYASAAAHLYLGFALRRFDPLLDRNI